MYAYKLLFVFLLPIITNTAPTKQQDGCGYQVFNIVLTATKSTNKITFMMSTIVT